MDAHAGSVVLHIGQQAGGAELIQALQWWPSLRLLDPFADPELADEPEARRGADPHRAAAEARLRQGMLERFQGRFGQTYRLDAATEDPELRGYLAWTIQAVQQSGRVPVLCLDHQEGLLPWLRQSLPGTSQIGLVAESGEVYYRWIQLALTGDWGPFESARTAVAADPEWYGQRAGTWAQDVQLLGSDELRRLFMVRNARSDEVRRHGMDLTVTVAELRPGGSPAKLASFGTALGLPPDQQRTLSATLPRSCPAALPRDRVTALVDAGLPQRRVRAGHPPPSDPTALRRELDEAQAELSRVYSSTSWRVTHPLRRAKDIRRKLR